MQQLLVRMNYMGRQGLQWEWHQGCKIMLSGWLVEQGILEVQSLESRSGWVLEEECHSRLEVRGRYCVTRQWHRVQAILRGMAQVWHSWQSPHTWSVSGGHGWCRRNTLGG